jgi:hypothetical protein
MDFDKLLKAMSFNILLILLMLKEYIFSKPFKGKRNVA